MSAAPEGQTRPDGRIPSGRFRELGPVNWVLAKLGARAVRAPEMHLFTTLGQRQVLFWRMVAVRRPAAARAGCRGWTPNW